MELTQFNIYSDADLMKIFNELNNEIIKRGHSYTFYHICIHNRKYRQKCLIENDFYRQMLRAYNNDTDLDLRFDPIIIQLINLFNSDTYCIKSIIVPLNKAPRIRMIDDGEYMNEGLEFVDSSIIFTPENICKDIYKANNFITKIKMITWDVIQKTYVKWEDEWGIYLNENGAHMTTSQLHNDKNNPVNKIKIFAKAVFDLDNHIIVNIAKINDDKLKLCKILLDIYTQLNDI